MGSKGENERGECSEGDLSVWDKSGITAELDVEQRRRLPLRSGIYYPEIKSFSLSVSRPLILGFRGEGGAGKK